MNPALLVKVERSAGGLVGQLRILSSAISLYVRLHFYDHSEAPFKAATSTIFDMSRLYHNSQKQGHQTGPGVLSVFPLYTSTMSLAYTFIHNLSLDQCEEQQV